MHPQEKPPCPPKGGLKPIFSHDGFTAPHGFTAPLGGQISLADRGSFPATS